ncbi:uncharacterized protein LOC129644775 [Bubalus kerabau]|uniref:uncharacterized protein LOC129644775 n=1 Tax=Bubalus carabanensis TaxID=3119969 RepID=UPI00244EF87D|nr:uncharacterized protein LOC129644775 [Bubalus carabanensis]XP_055426213.1 uncharacterized protein LOC129644775 [Bubalus carabanensis]
MEPKTPALSGPCPGHQRLPEELHELNTEFCDESVTYSEVKVRDSSNIQKRKLTRIWKAKESPWCIATVIFALLYLIALALAAFMIAKVNCLEEILNTQQNNKSIVPGRCNTI